MKNLKFTNLQAKTKREFRKHKIDFFSDLNQVKTLNGLIDDWRIKQYITPSYTGKILRSEISLYNAKQVIKKRYNLVKSKDLNEQLKHFESVGSSNELKEITVTIEYKKNKTWRYNPTANIRVISGENFNLFYNDYTSGSIGGCGYDKESTAFAKAVNQSYPFLKAMYKRLNKGEKFEYGQSNGKLSPGVGVSCYYRIFEQIGFKMEKVSSGKMFDVYRVCKK